MSKINPITHTRAVGWVFGELPGLTGLCCPAVTEEEGGNCHTTPMRGLGELSPNKTAHFIHINTIIYRL